MHILVVKFQLKPEFREKFLEAAMDDARGSNHDEPGCLGFDVVQDDADQNRIFFYEVYKDQAAFKAHTEAPHYHRYRDTVSPDWYAAPVEIARGANIYPKDADWNHRRA
jgi:(4S)-4-hydroxy-5-phosphonooxypentane-2,3-dione isomerase